MSGLRFPPTSRGYDLREVVSALQKAIRRSEPDNALYWATEMARSGYGNWCWKRLRIICSEDIGPACPGLAADVRALYENWVEAKDAAKREHRPAGTPGEEYLFLYHAVLAMCAAPKCRIVDWAIWYHQSDHVTRHEIPDEALDKHTLRGKNKGRGMTHFIEESSRLIDPGWNMRELEDSYLAVTIAINNKDPELPHHPFAVRRAEAEEGQQANMLDHETGAK